MHIHGRCHCGAISYEAEVDPGTVVLCHCADCQQFAGAPYRALIRPLPGSLRIAGHPTHYTKTADSGRQRAQGFCGTCGTQLYACDPGEAQANLALRIGAIAERHQLGTPARQIWTESALAWAFDLTPVPRLGGQ
ncbi:MAG TPA: GFA family protein [Croceibacterium sp.]